MSVRVDVQVACESAGLPTAAQITGWASAALGRCEHGAELTVRLVGEREGRILNREYRRRDEPTNVLSFPFEPPPGAELDLLGDVVICAPVVSREAAEQHKEADVHWAHMVVHGCLHLLGHDHQRDEDARVMESEERRIMRRLGLADPYAPSPSARSDSPVTNAG